jgi:hypothetical protein
MTMTTLTIKDLSASKELDGKAMAAVAGGTLVERSPLPLLILDYTSVSTEFPVHNHSAQIGYQANEVGSFNFGGVDQSNSQSQTSLQLGNGLFA